MKFNSLQELKAKVASLETPLYEKYSETFDEKDVYKELATIINNQLINAPLIPEAFQNLLLYINTTNSYVSCLWYDPQTDTILEDCSYSVVTFTKYQDEEVSEEFLDEDDFCFYWFIIETLKKFRLSSINSLGNVAIYESDQGDDVEIITF
ncbi:hypothetical protein [Kordia sp.]|uniref:hypothetical protein n=1 Tax=Kordia sp. TaxID=1965332 RepID=UPI003D2A47A9